jgi:hypothetical protein
MSSKRVKFFSALLKCYVRCRSPIQSELVYTGDTSIVLQIFILGPQSQRLRVFVSLR